MKHTEIFCGRIGKIDEAVRELGNGNCVANFSIAETPRYKKGDEWVDGVTIWTDVSIFGDEARNLVRSVVPGTFVLVVGNRTARKYKAKDTNEERTVQAVTAEEVAVLINKFTFIEKLGNVNYSKEGRTAGATSAPATKSAPAAASKPVADNPFEDQDPFAAKDAPFGADDPFGEEDDPFALA